MRITNVSSPNQIQQSQANPAAAAQARANAIAKLTGASSPSTPTNTPTNHPSDFNQNNISPEMASSVQPNVPKVDPRLAEKIQQNQSIEDVSQNNTSESTEETKPLSSQLAMLARKERALRIKQQQQEQALKQREAELKAKEDALLSKEKQYNPESYISKDLVKQNALKVLADAGVTYDELAQQVLNQTQTNPYTEAQISKLEAEIKRLSATLEESKQQQSQQQDQAMQAAIKQIKMDVKSLINRDPSFETIKATNSVDDVVELIRRTYDQDGYVMSVEEAAEEVENYLIDEALKLTRIQKIQKRLQPQVPASTKVAQQTQQPQKAVTQSSKTLTNAISNTRPLSARERALLAFEGKLK